MKLIFSFILTLPLLSVAADLPFNAYCELQKSTGSNFRGAPFAKLIATPEVSQLYTFDSSTEAEDYQGPEGDRADLYKAKLESDGKNKTFALPSLEHTKKVAGSALVYKVASKVFQNPADFKGTGKTFELRAENRDYDDDYSGVFFWTHGYVVKDRATFTCVVL
jgi:hypothetical protein